MSNFHRAAKGLSSQALVTTIMGILELVVFAVMSRILSKADFGLYAILQSMIIIFKALSEAGLGSSIIQKKGPSQEFVNTAFTLSIAFGFSFTVAAICCSGLIARFYKEVHLIIPFCLIAISLIPYSLNSIFRGLIFKELEFLKYGIYQISSYIISNIVGIVMACRGYGVYSLVVANMLNIVCQTFMLYFNCENRPQLTFSLSDAKMILSFGGLLTITRFFTQLYNQIDKLLIGKLLSVDILGVFYRIRGFIDSIDSQIGGVFDVTFFPILSDIQDNKASLQNAYLKSTHFSGILFFFIFLTFFFNAELIISIFLGEKWIDQVPLFRMLSCSMIIYSFSRLNDCFIRSLALLKFAFYLKIISIGVLLLFVFTFLRFKTIGVALALCVTNFLICMIKTLYVCRNIQLDLTRLAKSIRQSLRFSIPILILGICYMLYLDASPLTNVVFLIVYLLLAACIFFVFPNFVGIQYKELIYDAIKKRIK